MDASFVEQTPARVKTSQHRIQLFTENTPNGKRVQILESEMKLQYPTTFDCETHLVDLETDEQKTPWFLALNPAGRIPVLVDNSSSDGPVSVMESPAILLYMQENYDSENLFGFPTVHERSQVLQWLFTWHSAARLHGLTRAFMNEGPSNSTFVDSLRQRMLPIYGLIEDHLSGKHRGTESTREYLAGTAPGKYSIADIATWPHVRSWRSLGFTENDMSAFPCMLSWIDKIASRPAVIRGIDDKYYSSEHNVALVVKAIED